MSLNKTLINTTKQLQQQQQNIARKALASFTFFSLIYSQCKNINNNNNNNVLTQYSVQYYFLTSRDDEFRHL
jgi:membrane-bound lytic murein transglycosylase